MLRNAILIVGLKSLTMEASKQMRVSRPYKISESSKVRERSLPTRGIESDCLLLTDVFLTVAMCGFAEERLDIAPSILQITMNGGTKERWDFMWGLPSPRETRLW